MNRATIWLVLLGVVLLFGATSAVAGEKPNKTTITVADAVSVSGTTLTPGEYQVTWVGTTGQVELTFLKGKKVLTTAQARIETRTTTRRETVLVTAKRDGAVGISEIRPEGTKDVLVLGAAPAQH